MQKQFTFLLLLLIAIATLACGSSNESRPLSINLSPATSTIAVKSSVAISAQTAPALPQNFGSLTWMVKGFGTSCTEAVPDPANAPPMPACSSGWIAYAQTVNGLTPTAVHYYAATIPGSFTVMVNGVITDPSGHKIEYVGSAASVITVKAQ